MRGFSKHFNAIMEDLYAEIREEFPIFNEDSFDIAPSKFIEFLKAKGWLDNKDHPWPMTKGGKKGQEAAEARSERARAGRHAAADGAHLSRIEKADERA